MTEVPERRFNIGDIRGRQQGRIVEITHPSLGATYLVDVTNEQDKSEQPSGEPGGTIRIALRKYREDRSFFETFALNNSTFCIINQRLSPKRDARIYLGQDYVVNHVRQQTLAPTLQALSMREKDFPVPMSTYPEMFVLVMGEAELEIGDNCVFKDLRTKFIP